MAKKILWLCNHVFTEFQDKATGTWLSSLATKLLATGEVDLYNISQFKVKKCTRRNSGLISQWLVPYEHLNNQGLPSKKTITYIQNIVNEIHPDVIHIWGTENYWGLLTARKIIEGNVVLDVQGLIYACANAYYGGLLFKELISCLGVKELILPSCSIFVKKKKFEEWVKFEREIILKHNFILIQSVWTEAHVSSVNSEYTQFQTGRILRSEFDKALPWQFIDQSNSDFPIIFASCSESIPYKGLHILFRAVSLLKKKFPNISLNIAGSYFKRGIRNSGYSKWLRREARKLGIENSIKWLGSLDAAEIIEQFHIASAFVIPSFVESYSLSLAESMKIGVPTVVSYAGALAEVAQERESVLFFPIGDEVMCAFQIERILMNKELAESLSNEARIVALMRNDPEKIVNNQIRIYNNIMS